MPTVLAAVVLVGAGLSGTGLVMRDELREWACEARTEVVRPDGSILSHPRCLTFKSLSGGGESEEDEEADGAVKPDHPGEAVAFRRRRMKNEKGEIPVGAVLRAAEQLTQMRASGDTSVSPSGVKAGTWKALGPGNIGGRTRSIVVDKNNPDVIYLASVAGGIWKSVDRGVSWKVLSNFLSNMAVSTMVMDPQNSQVLYAGTGEGFFNGDGLRGAGILKTTDGGVTWKQLASTNNENFLYVNRLTISNSGSTILAATGTGIYRSNDRGATFTLVRAGGAQDVDFDPRSSLRVVASGYDALIAYSADGGKTWTNASGPPFTGSFYFTRIEAAWAKSQSGVVYLSAAHNSGEIWKSTDFGHTYTRVNTGTGYLGNQGWYSNALWVSPDDANLVVVGGLDLWRSTDGGVTLTRISDWRFAPASAHADHHVMVAATGYGPSNRTVYFGNDGGIYKANVTTVTANSGWRELNNRLGITQFYSAAGNPTTGKIIGGTQDNGTIFYDPAKGSESWRTTFGGDGGYSAADPTDPKVFYGEYIYLTLHRSKDGGQSASFIDDNLPDANACAEFIAPFLLDPGNPNRMWAGGCRLWRSDDVKNPLPTWTKVADRIGGTVITAIAVAPGNPNIVAYGLSDGQILISKNALSASPTFTAATGTPARRVNTLAVSKSGKYIFAGFSGFERGNIWRSADGGLTWRQRSGSGASATAVPAAPVYSIAIDPSRASWIYAGTEVGVVASEDGGATWFSPRQGPAYVSVDQVVFVGTKLVAATHGRGLFSTTPVQMTPTAAVDE